MKHSDTVKTIKPLKRTYIASRVIFIDNESRPIKVDKGERHEFKIGYAEFHKLRDGKYQLEDRILYRDLSQFFRWLESIVNKEDYVYIMAHNWHFDYWLMDFHEHMKERGWSLKYRDWEASRFVMKYSKGKRVIVLLDSTNFFKVPLAQLGKLLRLKKVKIKDFSRVSSQKLEKRVIIDVKILAQAITSFFEFILTEDLGNHGYSIASASFKAFRKRFLNGEIEPPRDPRVIKLESESYFGGRVECFRLGYYQGDFYVLDVNSLYPFVMKSNTYPVRCIGYYKGGDPETLRKLIDSGYLVIARVVIRTNQPIYPFKKERLIFPVGEFETTLPTPELKIALERGHIKEIREFSVYEGKEIFREFVEYFFKKRLQAKKTKNRVMDLFYKIILNSLYGKFGQRIRKWIKVEEAFPEDPPEKTIILPDRPGCYRAMKFDGWYWILEREKRTSALTFIAIASHVTSYARAYLWELMEKAGRNEVFYCDTDSLFITRKGYQRLRDIIDPVELGKLSLEAETKWLEIRGLKDYAYEGCEKIKGVGKYLKKLGENVYLVKEWLRSKSLVRKGLSSPLVMLKEKKLTRRYLKGIVTSSGRVLPFTLGLPPP